MKAKKMVCMAVLISGALFLSADYPIRSMPFKSTYRGRSVCLEKRQSDISTEYYELKPERKRIALFVKDDDVRTYYIEGKQVSAMEYNVRTAILELNRQQ